MGLQIQSVFENMFEINDINSNNTSSERNNSSITASLENIMYYLIDSPVYENITIGIYEELINITESQNGTVFFSVYESEKIHELLSIVKMILIQIESKINIRNYEKVTRISNYLIEFMREQKKYILEKNREEDIREDFSKEGSTESSTDSSKESSKEDNRGSSTESNTD